jgi:hypothetical protein
MAIFMTCAIETPIRFFRYSRMLLSSSLARKHKGGSCLAMIIVVILLYYYVKREIMDVCQNLAMKKLGIERCYRVEK